MQLTWKIEKLDVKPQADDLQNVVISANWRLEALDEREESRKREYVFGKTTFEPPSDTFIDFNSLTEDVVLSWVYEEIGQDQKAFAEKEVSDKLIASQNHEFVVKPLPWNKGV